jgi:DNA-binding response OmpR family regulator
MMDGMTPCVLIVEDDPDSGESLMALLTHAGFDVQWTRSVTETRLALASRRRLARALPQVVLLDLALTDGDGAELREAFDSCDPPPVVVIHSAAPADRMREAAGRMRAQALMRKPSNGGELVQLVEEMALDHARRAG